MSQRQHQEKALSVAASSAQEPAVSVVEVPSSSGGQEFGGSPSEVWNIDLLRRAMGTAWGKGGQDPRAAEDIVAITAVALRAFAPTDPVEAMIASQAVALHFASLECSRRAMLPNQPGDAASKLRRDAANTARAMVEMTEALQRRRGKGPQVVRVERVIVNEGGQAIVGHVAAPGSLPPSGAAAPLAIEQSTVPMSSVDAAPVEVHQGEGLA